MKFPSSGQRVFTKQSPSVTFVAAMMSVCNIDIETYSAQPIKYGVYAYSEHSSTEILVVCWSLDGGPVNSWASFDELDGLQGFIDILADPAILLRAYNAQFERVMLNSIAGQCLGIPHTEPVRWECTAVQAAMHALPRALGDCAAALGTHPKDETGKKIMMALSKPRTAGKMKGRPWQFEDRPDDYYALVDYCRDDVLAEQTIADTLPRLTQAEREFYWLDQRINDVGVPIDRVLAETITSAWPDHKERLNQQCKELTGGIGVAQVKTLTPWLGMKSLAKDAIRDELETATGDRKQVLELRAEASKTSVTKFNTMLKAVCKDGTLKGMFLFNGAQTGRWTGRIVQLHNLPRNTAEDPETLIADLKANPSGITGDIAQQLIRPTFQGGPRGLLIGDYSSIELRVALWFADDTAQLEKIRGGVDMYKDLATQIYKKHIDKISKDERFVGKQAVLGLGYGMGAKKFVEYCRLQGQPIQFALSDEVVGIYRSVYKSIYDTWWELEQAAVRAIKQKGKTQFCCDGKIKYVVRGNFLYCVLPSGRPITYPFPEVQQRDTPWGGKSPSITFMGVDQYTRKWSRQDTFGGRLFENVCQGTAACLLRNSLRVLDAHDYCIIGHVHDEVLSEGGPNELDHFTELMTHKPDWAEGIPMAVDAEHTMRYKKG